MKKQLIIHRLENLSKGWFKNHYELITKLIGKHPGIYALYDDKELYYVGKSVDLRGRVKHHLQDRHGGMWTHFSLFLLSSDRYIDQLESLVVRIVNPRGNRCKPRGDMGNTLIKQLEAMLDKKHKQEKRELFDSSRSMRRSTRIRASSEKKSLKHLVTKHTPIYRTYKGREYKAILTGGGRIKIGNKVFTTPMAAAKTIIDRRAVNGWKFWYIKDLNGEWVKLSDYKG